MASKPKNTRRAIRSREHWFEANCDALWRDSDGFWNVQLNDGRKIFGNRHGVREATGIVRVAMAVALGEAKDG